MSDQDTFESKIGDLEPELMDLHRMATVARCFFDDVFSPANTKVTAEVYKVEDANLILHWQVQAGMFCLFHLESMIQNFEETFMSILEGKEAANV